MKAPSTTTRRLVLGALAGLLASPAGAAWSISGTVTSTSGTALSGVAISVSDTAAIKTTSKSDGSFTLSSTTGVLPQAFAQTPSARVEDDAVVVEGLGAGTVELSLVSAAGRSLWTASGTPTSGRFQAPLPTGLSHGAVFLRIRHAQGTTYQAVVRGPAGLQFAAPAGRALATYPVIKFTLSGYDDTTYAMTGSVQTGVTVKMAVPTTCDIGTTFKWKDYGAPVAAPKNGWVSIKDFTHVYYNGQHIVHMTYYTTGWHSAVMAPFTDWSNANAAAQTDAATGVAPELMYYTPKNVWINSKQWCSGGSFCWMESTNPTSGSSFALKGNLLTETITVNAAAPIDHTLICDSTNCYIFYADDAGHIYRGSMAKSSFPGTFSGTKLILSESTASKLFEAVEVYKIKGQQKYLMMVECGYPRYFRAFTATSLGGTFTPVGNTINAATPFAGKSNVTGGWSDDISHGDMIRSSYDEYKEIDPCNMQLLYQGVKSGSTYSDYGLAPYQMGLLTATK
jgi:hypothetical protein